MNAAPAYVPFNLAAARAAFLRGDFQGVLAQARGTNDSEATRVWALAMTAIYGPCRRDGLAATIADARSESVERAVLELADYLGLRPLVISLQYLDSLSEARMFSFVERPAA